MKPINVGLLGIGTVGGGTFTVLRRNAEEITRRAGRPIRITVVADKNLELAKQSHRRRMPRDRRCVLRGEPIRKWISSSS